MELLAEILILVLLTLFCLLTLAAFVSLSVDIWVTINRHRKEHKRES